MASEDTVRHSARCVACGALQLMSNIAVMVDGDYCRDWQACFERQHARAGQPDQAAMTAVAEGRW